MKNIEKIYKIYDSRDNHDKVLNVYDSDRNSNSFVTDDVYYFLDWYPVIFEFFVINGVIILFLLLLFLL